MRSRMGLMVILATSVACSGPGDGPRTVLEHLVELGTVSSGPSYPTSTRCGRYQDGYRAADPTTDPPTPQTLRGDDAACRVSADCRQDQEQVCVEGTCRRVYDVTRDGFCTIERTIRFYEADGVVYREEDLYLLEMSEPVGELPEHLVYLREQLAEPRAIAAHYCTYLWRVEPVPVGAYSEQDVQLLEQAHVGHPSYFCSRFYNRMIQVIDGFAYPEVVIRTTDPAVVLDAELPDDVALARMGRVAFRGYAGMREPVIPGQSGNVTGMRDCTPTAVAGGGPGVCEAEYRRGGPSDMGRYREITFDDIDALPANPCLIDPAWIDANRALYDRFFAGQQCL